MALLFLLPAFVLLILFRLIPIADAFRLSFTRWNGFSAPEFIGFDNYTALPNDPVFKTALRNNLIVLAAVPIGVIGPFLLATLLHARIWGWRFFRMAFFLPAVLSPVIIGSFFEVMLRFDGPINTLLRSLGLDSLALQWLADSRTALYVYIAVMLWIAFGVGVLLFMASLSGTDPDLAASAQIDGASWLQVQWHVVLPQVRPMIEFWTVLLIIVVFTTQFPLVFTLTRGGPGHASTILEFLIYQRAFANGALGFASALGVMLFLFVLVLASLQIFLFRRRGWEST